MTIKLCSYNRNGSKSSTSYFYFTIPHKQNHEIPKGRFCQKRQKWKTNPIVIDMRIHKNTMRPVLREMLNKQREAFYRGFNNAITVEEVRQRMYEHIDKLLKNKE